MKRMSAIITVNGVEKQISVWLDDTTAKILETVEPFYRDFYIRQAYRDRLTERKEIRRTQSLETSVAGGFDFPDWSCTDEAEKFCLRQALELFPPDQKWAIVGYYFHGIKQSELARLRGVFQGAIAQLLERARKNLRCILADYEE